MRTFVSILLLLLSWGLGATGGRFVNYGSADGLSSNTIYAITQDSEGFLWIGTRNGLNRFDGARFRSWKQEDGLPAARVTSLAVDRQDRIWTGTTEGICVKDGDSFVHGPKKHIRALCCDSDGAIWASTADSLILKLEYNPAEGIRECARCNYSMVYAEGDYPYHQLYEDEDGKIWIGGRIVHCQYIQDRVRPECIIQYSRHCAMGSYSRIGDKLYSFDDFHSELCIIEDELRSLGRAPLAHGRLMADSRGRLWCAGSYGLALMDSEKPEKSDLFKHNPADATSLSSNELYCLFEDVQGNIWVGGDNGLSVLSPSFQQAEMLNLPTKMITALMQDSSGRLWVGTGDCGAFIVDGSKQTRVDYRPGRRANEGYVSSLYEDREGTIYIGLWAGVGFNIWKNGRMSRGKISGALPKEQHVVAADMDGSNWISAFLEDDEGRFWVATWEGAGLNGWDRSSGRTLAPRWMSPFKYPSPEKDSCIYLSSRLASCLIADREGNMVFGTTEAGMNIIDKQSGLVRKFYKGNSSIPDDYVTDLCLGADGSIWAATHAGIWSPDGRHFLGGMSVQSLECDAAGRLWAGTEEGLYFIEPDGSTGVVRKKLGLPSDIYGEKVSCTLADGSLAFGGSSGAAIFHPDSLLTSAGRSEILLSDYLQEGSRLAFSFSVKNLPQAPLLKYRYRLEGSDKDWISADYPLLQGKYNGLPPGRYTLRIQCSDIFGRWQDGGFSQEMRIYAPLLLRWPFLILYIALLAGLVLLGMRLRERKLRQDNARLEEAVKQKTARIREELETRNRFFDIISHDLRNPVSGIRQLSESLDDNFDALPGDQTKLGVKAIRESADRTSEMLENLLMWSVSQKGVLKPVLREEKLSEIVSEAIGGRAISTDFPKNMTVLTDRHMLTTCLRNLLDNAVKHTPSGGKVTIKAVGCDISISDQGPGMDEETMKSLSRPGHLGLVITRELLDKLGASLQARNLPGGGCEMTIHLKRND